MKKIFFIIPIFLIVVLSWCNKDYDNVSFRDNSSEYLIKTWSINSYGSFVGNVTSKNQTNLSFKVPWRVVSVNYRVWDYVKKWSIIATVDTNYSSIWHSSVSNILFSLEQTKSSTERMFDNQISAAESMAAQALNSINMIKSSFQWSELQVNTALDINTNQLLLAEKQIEAAEVAVNSVLSEINNSKIMLNQKEENIYSNSISAISASSILISNYLNYTDEILWVSDWNRHRNDSFEIFLSAKNSWLKSSAEFEWQRLNNIYDDLISSYNIWNLSYSDEIWKKELYDILLSYDSLLSEFRIFSSLFHNVLDNSVASVDLPQSKIDYLKSNNISFQQNIERAILDTQWNFIVWIKGSIQSIWDFWNEKISILDRLNNNLQQAEKNLLTAKQSYNTYKSIWNSEITQVSTQNQVLMNQLKVYEEQYNQAINQINAIKEQKNAELSSIQAQIQELSWERTSLSQQIADAVLVAPFDWIIVSKNIELWQIVWPELQAISLSSNDNIELNVMLPESIIPKVSLWDEVIVNFWSSSLSTTWYVWKIDPIVDPMSKRVRVYINFNNIDNISIWMYWSVSFPFWEQFWLIAPYSFVRFQFWKPYLRLLDNEKVSNVNIDLWLCVDWYCLVTWDIIPWSVIIR